MSPELQRQKEKMQAIAEQLKLEKQKSAETNQRAGGFGKEMEDAVNAREDTYRTLDNDVNTRQQSYFHTLEDILPMLKEKYGEDPIYGLNQVGRERQRRGTAWQNSEDNRERKKGNIADFIGGLVQAAQLVSARKAQDVANTGDDYTRERDLYSIIFAEEQEKQRRREAASALAAQERARASSAASSTKGVTAGYLQALEAKAEDYATKALTKTVGSGKDAYIQPAQIGSPEWQKVKDQYLYDTLSRSQSTWGDAGYDSPTLLSYMNGIKPKSLPAAGAAPAGALSLNLGNTPGLSFMNIPGLSFSK